MKNSKVIKVKISIDVYKDAVKTIYGIGNEDTDLGYHLESMDILPDGVDIDDITFKGPKGSKDTLDFIQTKDEKPFLVKPSRWDVKYCYSDNVEDIIDIEVDLEAVAEAFDIACREVKDSHILGYIKDSDVIKDEVKRLTGKSYQELEKECLIDNLKISLISDKKVTQDPTIKVLRNSKSKKTSKKSK